MLNWFIQLHYPQFIFSALHTSTGWIVEVKKYKHLYLTTTKLKILCMQTSFWDVNLWKQTLCFQCFHTSLGTGSENGKWQIEHISGMRGVQLQHDTSPLGVTESYTQPWSHRYSNQSRSVYLQVLSKITGQTVPVSFRPDPGWSRPYTRARDRIHAALWRRGHAQSVQVLLHALYASHPPPAFENAFSPWGRPKQRWNGNQPDVITPRATSACSYFTNPWRSCPSCRLLCDSKWVSTHWKFNVETLDFNLHPNDYLTMHQVEESSLNEEEEGLNSFNMPCTWRRSSHI